MTLFATPSLPLTRSPICISIIGFVETLSEVDTNNVEPLASVVDNELRLREDKVVDGGQQDAVLKNAPETAEGYFVISKVVE